MSSTRAKDKKKQKSKQTFRHFTHLLDDTVELGSLISQLLGWGGLLASAKAAEVLSCLGDGVREELHGDAALGLAVDADVEVDLGVGLNRGVLGLVARHG